MICCILLHFAFTPSNLTYQHNRSTVKKNTEQKYKRICILYCVHLHYLRFHQSQSPQIYAGVSGEQKILTVSLLHSCTPCTIVCWYWCKSCHLRMQFSSVYHKSRFKCTLKAFLCKEFVWMMCVLQHSNFDVNTNLALITK